MRTFVRFFLLALTLGFPLPAGGAPKTICGLPADADATLSPDGKQAAFIRDEPSDDTPDGKVGALWVRDCRTGRQRLLLPAIAPEGTENGWVTLSVPVFSLDGTAVYVDGGYGGSSLMLHRVDVKSGRRTFIAAAELAGIIRTGPYRGDILATQHTALYKGEDSYGGYPFYVFDPQGRVLRYIGGSQAWDDKRLQRWLKGQGWQVSWAGRLAP